MEFGSSRDTLVSQGYDAIVTTPVGQIGIRTSNGRVTEVALGLQQPFTGKAQNQAALDAAEQLIAYFADPSMRFSIPLSLGGTDFQRKVWHALQRIPVGTTVSYGELARRLGTSARAVGGACRANPCPVLVPCHRVVASNGGLGGFGGRRDGSWPEIKRRLLDHEAAVPQ